MAEIARLIGRVVKAIGKDDFASVAAAVRDDVRSLCAQFPPYPELAS
jgi:glycine/serine hydroxymethyltransferase